MKLKSSSMGIFAVSARRFPGWLMGSKDPCHFRENGSNQVRLRRLKLQGIAHEFVRCYHSDSAFDALDGTRYVRSRNV